MGNENITISSTLLGVIITGIIGLATTVAGIVASRNRERAEAEKTKSEGAGRVVDSSVVLLD